MACTSCGRENPGGARFCGGCGTVLVRRCPACDADAAPDARFCVACGAALGARPAERSAARKMVTVVFADLIGSVSLHERLDAESVRRLMDRYHRTMAAAVERHGGRVVQLLGDGVLAAFGVPRVAEDDAVRAVRAGVEMQGAYRALVRELGAPLDGVGLRVAVNTGEIVVGDDETAVIGDPTNVAARLQHEARDGDVIVGESTQLLVAEHVTLAPLGTFALRGRAEAVDAYRVVSLERPASARATPFVGREAELRRLWSAYDDAVAAPGARLAVLLASPGLGKSRLLGELERRAAPRATVLSARCDAAGGATFAPIADALRAHLHLGDGATLDELRAALATLPASDDAERARIVDGVGALIAGTPAAPEETFFAVRRLLAALANERPVLLAIDDVHWAEPLLLDLVEHLVQWSAGVPLLIVVAARPELRDLRPSLTVPGRAVSELVTLGALDAGAATRLAAGIAGGAELPAALVGRVLAASEGHPLFLAELVRMLVQDGTLRRDGDRWVTTVEVAKLDMPPTIQVLLAARIERLAPEERAVLERAAVIGRQFSRGAVAHLLPGGAADLDAHVAALERSELIEPDAARYLGEPALRFHHVLIRDAAYRRVLKETRAELHERLADWIAARGGDGGEHEETLGWHLEQAHQNLRELGPLDARGHGLGERAARHLGAAGRRALAREDLALAASLLGRAIDALEPQHPLRAELAPDWCEALLSAGEVGAAARAIDELARAAGESSRLRAWHACFAAQLATLTDPQSLRPTAARVAAAADALAAAGDPAGEAKAHAVHAGVLARLGAIGQSEAALDKALAAARRAHDRRRANAVLAGAPVAALWGPSPVTRASGRCLDVVRVLRITQGAPAVEAVALRCQAVLETLRGRGEAARRMIASSRRMVEELGIAQQVLDADVFAGIVELLEGDAAAAASCLRTAYDGLRARGLGIDAARAAALLGRALLAQDRVPEAEELSRESEALAGDDLKAAIAWRGVRAEALARRGESDAALTLARAAVDIAAGTDALLDHADARVALATALRAAGRDGEADEQQRRAVELWEAKGAAVLVTRAGRSQAAAAPAAGVTAPASSPPSHDVAHSAQATHALRAVRPNAATAEVARLDAAVAARDLAAVERLFEAVVAIVHHPLETTYDRAGAIASFRMLFRDDDVHLHDVPIATLGESLALCRQRVTCGGLARKGVDAGPFEGDQLWLSEVDARGRRVHAESFATDRLNEAVAALYRRHAAREPEGPRRVAATRTARLVASLMSLDDFEDTADLFAADAVVADHRVLGLGSLCGRDAVLIAARSLHRHARDVTMRIEELFAVRPDVLFLRSVTRGTERTGGAGFELPAFQIRFFDADGRLQRTEFFDPDDGAAAHARFAELAAAHASGPGVARRAIRPNAATDEIARLDRLVAARDLDGIAHAFADLVETAHRPLGITWDRAGAIASFRLLIDGGQFVYRHAPLATLGDSLALSRQKIASTGMQREDFDIGALENDYLWLSEVNAAGRRVRSESFTTEQLGLAIARLYERHAQLLPDGTARARATAIARGVAAVLGVGADGGPVADGRGSPPDDAGGRVQGVREIVALEPDALIARCMLRGDDRETGAPTGTEVVVLWAFGPGGVVTHQEERDAAGADAAVARLAEIRAQRARDAAALPANRATEHARRLDDAWAARDDGRFARRCAPELEVVHHPTGTTYGRDEALARFRRAMAQPVVTFRHEPCAVLGDRLGLFRVTTSSSRGLVMDELDAGAFEIEYVAVIEADDDARATRVEVFAADRLGDAVTALYARHAALVAPHGGRAAELAAAVAAVIAMHPDAIARVLAPDVRFTDHRRLGLGTARGAELYLRGVRSLFDMTREASNTTRAVLAASERVLLLERTLTGLDRSSGGAFELHVVMLWGFGHDGRVSRIEMYDGEQIDRARAAARAIDADRTRVAMPGHPAVAGAMAAFAGALERRDWEALAACLAPDLTTEDHRRLGWETLHGPAPYVAALRGLVELAPDTRMRLEHVETVARGFLVRTVWTGTRDGGAFEEPSVMVGELDEHDRVRRFDQYEIAQLDAARARLAGIAATAAADPLARWLRPNAATAAHDRFASAIAAGDPAAMRAAFAADAVIDDRRALFRAVIDADTGVAAMRRAVSADERGLHIVVRLVAVLGDRVALQHQVWTGGPEDAPFEVEMLAVIEAGRDGRLARVVAFDCDDRRAAFREANARWAAAEPDLAPLIGLSSEYFDATAARDVGRVRALLADDVVVHSRRRTGTGLLEGVDAYLSSLTAIWELTADSQAESLAALALDARGALLLTRVAGTLHDGGSFETLACTLVMVANGRFTRFEQFELEDADRARARFAELTAGDARAGDARAPHVARDPLPIPPNGATRARNRSRALAAAGDAEALRALCAPDVFLNDRRPLIRTVGGRDMLVADAIQIPREVWRRTTHTLLSTCGDRLGLHHHRFTGAADGGAFEIETLDVTEVDEQGRIAALVIFDVGDRHAAAVEMLERYVAGEGGASMPPAQIAFLRALHARDPRGMRAALDDDFVFVDHRRAVTSRVTGADAYVASFAAPLEQTTELALEVLYDVAVAEHGSLSVARLSGTSRAGGAFESSPLVRIDRNEHGRHVGVDLFEVDDLERARARFAQLGMRHAALLAAPHVAASAAWRACDRWGACVEARDWHGLRAVLAPDLAWEDRRRLFGMSGDRDTVLETVRLAVSARLRPVRAAVVAAPGDRVLLLRQDFHRGEGEAAVQIEMLQLYEVDGEGRIVTLTWFDADDEPAAIAEAERRAAAARIA